MATTTTTETDWDLWSHTLLGLYRDWVARLCSKCGHPLTDHDGTTIEDWHGGFYTCVGVAALRRDQKNRVRIDGGEQRHAELQEGRSWYIGRVNREPA